MQIDVATPKLRRIQAVPMRHRDQLGEGLSRLVVARPIASNPLCQAQEETFYSLPELFLRECAATAGCA